MKDGHVCIGITGVTLSKVDYMYALELPCGNFIEVGYEYFGITRVTLSNVGYVCVAITRVTLSKGC